MKIIKITKLPKLCLSLSFRFFSFPDMFLSFDYKFSMSDRKFIGSLVANKTAVLFCNSTRFSIESRARTKLFPDACFKAVISRIYPSSNQDENRVYRITRKLWDEGEDKRVKAASTTTRTQTRLVCSRCLTCDKENSISLPCCIVLARCREIISMQTAAPRCKASRGGSPTTS